MVTRSRIDGRHLTFALLIPAYEPSHDLTAALDILSRSGLFQCLIVVNDGSPASFDPVFEEAARIPGVHVIRHAVNSGKGAALKSGFRYALDHVPNLSGVITADADGQHLPNDILKVTAALAETPDSLVLGVRGFQGHVPFRSRFGNYFSRLAFRLLSGPDIADTQTGLRGVPSRLLPELLRCGGNGYDFELEMLLAARRLRCATIQVPVQTVYAPGNGSSHFRPFLDSISIGAVLLRPRLPLVIAFLLIATGALTAYGLVRSSIFSQTIWFPQGAERALWFAALSFAVLTPVLVFAHRYVLPILLGLVLALTIVATGPWAPLTVLFFLYSCTVLGGTLFQKVDPPVALLTGAAIFISLEEALVRLPWNYPWTYAALMFLPVLIAPRVAWRTFQSARSLLLPRPLSPMERAAVACLALILSAHWLMALEPEVSTDGLAMHLAIPDGVAWRHIFAFALPRNVWAAMPMGGDWCFTLVYLTGGEFAARLLNLTFLLLIAVLLYRGCLRMVCRASALWVTALFASTPLVQLVTGSLFIENILAAVLLGGLTALWRYHETGRTRYVYAAALLFGTALHIKLSAFAFLIPALMLLCLELRRQSVWLYARAAVILTLAAAPPYVIAALKTGDPVFPFLNTKFHSSVLAPDVNLDETRFHEPLRLSTPYALVFHTSRYYEGQDGSFGLQYLLLLPTGLLLVRRRSYVGWSATVIGLTGCLLVLLIQPNLRYLYPELPLLHLTIAFLLASIPKRPLFAGALTAFLFAASFSADLYLFPSSNWYHKDFYTAPPTYLALHEPRRLLIADLNQRHPGEAVFLPEDSAIADIHAPVFRNHWHDQLTKRRLDLAHDGDEVLELMRQWNVQRFLMPVQTEGIGSRVVREFAACVQPEFRIGNYSSGYLSAACEQKLRLWKSRRDALAQLGVIHDDSDAFLKPTGQWVHDNNFPLAIGGTVTYSNLPGSTIRFTFEGVGVTYVYTAAANRGVAQIELDGSPQPDLDLYRNETQWQSNATFGGLPNGPHVIEITVAGLKTPASKGTYIDLDAFVVKPR